MTVQEHVVVEQECIRRHCRKCSLFFFVFKAQPKIAAATAYAQNNGKNMRGCCSPFSCPLATSLLLTLFLTLAHALPQSIFLCLFYINFLLDAITAYSIAVISMHNLLPNGE